MAPRGKNKQKTLSRKEGMHTCNPHIKIEHQNRPLLLFHTAHNDMLLFEQKRGIRWYFRLFDSV